MAHVLGVAAALAVSILFGFGAAAVVLSGVAKRSDVVPLLALVGTTVGVAIACVAIGASWFAAGKGAILANFPTSTVEAVACTAGGVVVMLWAVIRILRELAKQGPVMQAKYDAYVGAQHPDKVRKTADNEKD